MRFTTQTILSPVILNNMCMSQYTVSLLTNTHTKICENFHLFSGLFIFFVYTSVYHLPSAQHKQHTFFIHKFRRRQFFSFAATYTRAQKVSEQNELSRMRITDNANE